MNKRGWFILILIVSVNALAIALHCHSHLGNYACFHVGGAGDPACCNCRFCRKHNQIPLQ